MKRKYMDLAEYKEASERGGQELENISHYFFNVVNIKKEWEIFSKCFGKVIVLNGPSSCGKSTMARELCDKGEFNFIEVDQFQENQFVEYYFKTLEEDNSMQQIYKKLKHSLSSSDFSRLVGMFKVTNVEYEDEVIRLQNRLQELEEFEGMDLLYYDLLYDKVKEFIFRGENVIIDLCTPAIDEIRLLHYCFGYYPMQLFVLYIPMEDNLERCFARNKECTKIEKFDFRLPSSIIAGYQQFYSFVDIQNPRLPARVNKKDLSKSLEKAKKEEMELLEEQILLLYNEEPRYETGVQYLDKKIREVITIITKSEGELYYDCILQDHTIIDSLQYLEQLIYQNCIGEG